MSNDRLISDFISHDKSMLIAPAGYGKTHTIAECIKQTQGKQLILTHTHAGIASIKEKIQNQSIKTEKYHIETITSYAQKYVLSFYQGNDMPEQDSKEYWPFILKKASHFLSRKPIQDIVKISYAGLFVDEYQDCTKLQHQLILLLSSVLPTHILGDPLQGIFEFNEELVDLSSADDMGEFMSNSYKLEEPWRWKKEGNTQLGECLKLIRGKLENNEQVDFSLYNSVIEVNQVDEGDLYKRKSDYNKKMWSLLKEESLLIIHPISTGIKPREKIASTFSNKLTLVEAIDGSDFYEIAKTLDLILKNPDNLYVSLKSILEVLYPKTKINEWFGINGLKSKRKQADQEKIEPIKDKIDKLNKGFSYFLLAEVIEDVKKILSLNGSRKELINDIPKALKKAYYDKSSVYDAMSAIRNQKRIIGRKVKGKCIGTTLLTKGLEFDTVAIINAHKFTCNKNLYVALTRASKKLIIFYQPQTK